MAGHGHPSDAHWEVSSLGNLYIYETQDDDDGYVILSLPEAIALRDWLNVNLED